MHRFILLLLCCSAALAQDIDSGKALFRSNCAFCHGVTAAGGRGPSLLTARVSQATPEALKNIVRQGIPGTSMPAFDSLDPEDLTRLVAFIGSLSSAGAAATPIPGNAAHGEQIYSQSGCPACHRIGERGSDYGPSLARIGGARSQTYIRESILEPSADIPPEYEGVTVVTNQGKKLTGARVNEDTFSIQLRLQNGSFAMFPKSQLKQVTNEKKSLMPAYKMSPADLQDLLAYLDTLRGDTAAAGDAAKAKGVH